MIQSIRTPAALLMLGSVSCGSDPMTLEESVDFVARVEPSRINQGDSAAVVAVFHNKTDKDVSLGFAMGCPFYLAIIDEGSGERVPFKGADYGCLAVVTSLEVPARDSLVWETWIEARLNGELAPPGNYTARLRSTGASPDLEAYFVVQ